MVIPHNVSGLLWEEGYEHFGVALMCYEKSVWGSRSFVLLDVFMI
jgi:hypothetical protein